METKQEIKVGDVFFDQRNCRFLEVESIDFNAQTRNMKATRGYFLTAFTRSREYHVKGMKLESEMRKYIPVPDDDFDEMYELWCQLEACFGVYMMK